MRAAASALKPVEAQILLEETLPLDAEELVEVYRSVTGLEEAG